MNKSILLAAFLLLGSGIRNLQATSANTNALLVSFQITAVVQQMTAVTNGDVVTTTYTAMPARISNQNILNMLQTEFGVTFPAGAQLGYVLSGTTGFHVLDQNGNSILDASTNAADSDYGFVISNAVNSSVQPVGSGKMIENTLTSNQTQSVTEFIPDYGIYYFDGHGNNFHIDGLLAFKPQTSTTSSNTVYNSVSFVLVGAGGGTFLNPSDGLYDSGVFIKAKVTGKGAGITQ